MFLWGERGGAGRRVGDGADPGPGTFGQERIEIGAAGRYPADGLPSVSCPTSLSR